MRPASCPAATSSRRARRFEEASAVGEDVVTLPSTRTSRPRRGARPDAQQQTERRRKPIETVGDGEARRDHRCRSRRTRRRKSLPARSLGGGGGSILAEIGDHHRRRAEGRRPEHAIGRAAVDPAAAGRSNRQMVHRGAAGMEIDRDVSTQQQLGLHNGRSSGSAFRRERRETSVEVAPVDRRGARAGHLG